jgi:hypothetical protein
MLALIHSVSFKCVLIQKNFSGFLSVICRKGTLQFLMSLVPEFAMGVHMILLESTTPVVGILKSGDFRRRASNVVTFVICGAIPPDVRI